MERSGALTDTKLNRDVAIKILPESFAQDADRMARFKQLGRRHHTQAATAKKTRVTTAAWPLPPEGGRRFLAALP